MKLKTLLISAALAIASVCSANAVVITTFDSNGITRSVSDDFERGVATAYQSATQNIGAIGEGYTVVSGSIRVATNKLDTSVAGLEYRNDLRTLSTGDFSFTLRGDVFSPNGTGKYGGLIFNLNDGVNTATLNDSYYALRTGYDNSAANTGIFELIKVTDGTIVSLNKVTNIGLVTNTTYTLSVWTLMGQPNTFNYSIAEIAGGAIKYSNSFTDTSFVDGYGGFVKYSSGTGRYDNFSLTVLEVPEPSTVALLGIGMAGVLFLRKRARSRQAS